MQKKPVWLLVDDDEDDHELFIYALGQVDPSVSCVTATNGQIAIEMLHNGEVEPDFIFLDLNMPLMGGKEFLLLIKEDDSLKNIPIIIYSTSSDPADREETSRLGAVDFITKPAKISGLTDLITNFISLHEEGRDYTNT